MLVIVFLRKIALVCSNRVFWVIRGINVSMFGGIMVVVLVSGSSIPGLSSGQLGSLTVIEH